ncbi:hypothetical protein EH223_17540 [candidate division KSB1 bacterium]|nr:UvrB/UvrC motif-containing protein [candidate division KSB1 bacterium]RQW00556.1 MAG: hypothetical protein EH223_17540 [candidate division KSB1 bacterium]
MFDDISHILESWKFNEHDINVRLISGIDGRMKIQMRIDLGILQMELDGRPDGRKPRNFSSYLDYFESKAQTHKSKTLPFILSPMNCFKLQQEAIQYYHRYLALMKLRDFPRVSRDTRRNLRVFDFVEKYADNDEIIWQFQQHRPYVIMMNTRASASMELDQSNYEKAIEIIKEAIQKIESHNEKWNERVGPDSPELEFLNYWIDEISELKPLSAEERLNKELEKAILDENYERAAILRDKLALLKK